MLPEEGHETNGSNGDIREPSTVSETVPVSELRA